MDLAHLFAALLSRPWSNPAVRGPRGNDFNSLLAQVNAAMSPMAARSAWLAVGEPRDAHAASYANFLGKVSLHTPADDLTATGPEILKPVARAFVDAGRKIVEGGDAAFKW